MGLIVMGKKYLIKKGYSTEGGVEFHRDMEKYQLCPFCVRPSLRDGIVEVPTTGFRHSPWKVRESDLIPYLPKQLENK